MNNDTRDFLATLLQLADDPEHDTARPFEYKTIQDFAPEFIEEVERFIDAFRTHLEATGFDMSALDGMERSFGGNVFLSLSGHGAGFFDDADERIAGLHKVLEDWADYGRFSALEYSLDVRPDGKIDLSVLPNFKQCAYKNMFGLPGEEEKTEEKAAEPSATPWKLGDKTVSYYGLEELLKARPEAVVVTVPAPPFAFGACGAICVGENARANAERIVSRVNAHDKLVEAIKDARACMMSARVEVYSHDRDEYRRIEASIDKAHEALKAAGETLD